MRPLIIIRLVFTFYKSFLLFSLLITIACLRTFWMQGFAAFFGIFWCKLITLGITYYFINVNKKHEYYYYRNLGVSRTLLWTAALSFDFILFIFLIILAAYLR